jgi:hypothetical protein
MTAGILALASRVIVNDTQAKDFLEENRHECDAFGRW